MKSYLLGEVPETVQGQSYEWGQKENINMPKEIPADQVPVKKPKWQELYEKHNQNLRKKEQKCQENIKKRIQDETQFSFKPKTNAHLSTFERKENGPVTDRLINWKQ